MSAVKIPSFKLHYALSIACAAVFVTLSQAAWAAPVLLITEAEAKLPPLKGASPSATRGITRGPRIEVVDTATDGSVHSPMHLQIKFQTFGGAQVDPNALQVTYLKSPEVDLTDRVKPFVQPTGIDMPEVALPPGDHILRVDIKDTDGRSGTTSFVLKVTP